MAISSRMELSMNCFPTYLPSQTRLPFLQGRMVITPMPITDGDISICVLP